MSLQPESTHSDAENAGDGDADGAMDVDEPGRVPDGDEMDEEPDTVSPTVPLSPPPKARTQPQERSPPPPPRPPAPPVRLVPPERLRKRAASPSVGGPSKKQKKVKSKAYVVTDEDAEVEPEMDRNAASKLIIAISEKYADLSRAKSRAPSQGFKAACKEGDP